MVVASTAKVWTLEELHSLPDDGNRYELVHGDLFVTPAPSYIHQSIAAHLGELLTPFVASHGLGRVFQARSVVQFRGSEVEPDIFVAPLHPNPETGWETAPTPLLVVEIVSRSTRRRDYGPKKDFYLELGIPEYWIVDRERRTVTVIRPGELDRVEHERVTWTPPGLAESLTIDVHDAIGRG